VKEVFEVNFTSPTSDFERTFTAAVTSDVPPVKQFIYIENEYIESNAGNLTYSIIRGGESPSISVRPGNGTFRGLVRFTFTYDLAGAVFPVSDDTHRFYYDAIKYDTDEPLNSSTFNLELPSSVKMLDDDVYISSQGRVLQHIPLNWEDQHLSANINWDARHVNELQVGGTFKSTGMDYSDLPAEVFYKDYAISNYEVNIELEDQAALQVEEIYELNYKYADAYRLFKPVMSSRYYRGDFKDASGKGHFPGVNILKPEIRQVAKVVETSDALESYNSGYGINFRVTGNSKDNSNRYSLIYNTNGNYESSNGDAFFAVKLSNPAAEPLSNMTVKIDKSGFEDIQNAHIKNGKNYTPIELSDEGDYFTGSIINQLYNAEQPIVLQFLATTKVPVSKSLFARLGHFVNQNIQLTVGLLWITFLSILWWFIGRDKKWKKSVAFEPPVGMTPAEAGYIWDGKIHKRDLVSLIYFWAAADVLEIGEEKTLGKTDYVLYKMKELPDDAQPFEKKMFKGLFEDGDEIKVSETRNSLFTTMRKAHKDLKLFGKKYRFWIPGTRGFGVLLIVIGIVAVGAGLLMLGYSASNNDFTYSVPLLLAGIFSVVFGIKMPKKSQLGTEVYHELLSFREFMRTADLKRLEELYEKDSNYFNRTISFAIVMGMGKTWARKFKGLIIEPPKYYRGYDQSTPWDTIIYTDWIMSGMHRMNRDFNYQVPASSSSGGSSNWGGSGGSFSGGGFSSGGGFGGGGSSSW
jgi:uncharacterized membrane protein YgcG